MLKCVCEKEQTNKFSCFLVLHHKSIHFSHPCAQVKLMNVAVIQNNYQVLSLFKKKFCNAQY